MRRSPVGRAVMKNISIARASRNKNKKYLNITKNKNTATKVGDAIITLGSILFSGFMF